MLEDWTFDEDDIIDACLNEALIAELGLPVLTRLVIVELRRVKSAPRSSTHAHLIGAETVYLRRIAKEWANGKSRPALMLTYTLFERVIQPLWVFKASEVEEGGEIVDSGPLAPLHFDAAPRGKGSADGPLPDAVERRLERELRNAQRRRKH
jgi:hypothetical protein